MNNNDIAEDGFMPLKKIPTMPKTLPSGKGSITRGMSFNAETGEKEDPSFLWGAGGAPSGPGSASSHAPVERSRANTYMGDAPPPLESLAASVPAAVLEGAVVVVDPFSTGLHVAAQSAKYGVKVVRVLSIWDSPVASLVNRNVHVDYAATVQHNDTVPDQDAATNDTIKQLKELPFKIVAVMAGAETGVELADRLSSRMGLRSNGERKSLARRHKYHMGEAVRAAGVRAVKQAVCKSNAELDAFIATLPQINFKCVIKPVQSAGSDDVFLCDSPEEARVAFNRIYGTRNGLGLMNDSALVQEFLRGTEYVIDSVSKDGVHKTTAVWKYDKRKTNGAPFVYYAMFLVDPKTKLCQDLIAYGNSVLDALDIRQGPGHMEVYHYDAPENEGGGTCLVEVGARCHGAEGNWIPIVDECVGYSMMSIMVDVYLNGGIFETIDANFYPKKKFGISFEMVAHTSGIIRGFPGEKVMQSCASYRSVYWEPSVGSFWPKTIDCFTRPGCIRMVHDSEEVIMRDYHALHKLELDGEMIEYSIICPAAPSAGSIVIVDPYTSGSHLAAKALQWGYKLILVFTQSDTTDHKGATTLEAQYGPTYKPTLMVQHAGATKAEALKNTLAVLNKQQEKSPILAILPGADCGVEVAEQLAREFGTRCNADAASSRNRDKVHIQDAIAKGSEGRLRTVKQQLCTSDAAVKAFFASCSGGVVMKPRFTTAVSGESGMSMLCRTEDEAVYAYNTISSHCSRNRLEHGGVLAQENLSGTEFIVNGVCRDGKFKVTALWECEKRSINGSDFVPFSMKLASSASGIKELTVVEFARKAVLSLGLRQGPVVLKVIDSDVHMCPLLVEVSGSCHSMDDSWMTAVQECVGYSQVDAVMDSYLRPDRFDEIPADATAELKANGMEVYLMGTKSGVVKEVSGLSRIRALASCKRVDMFVQPGGFLSPTADYATRMGTVVLAHSNAAQLAEDCEAIRKMEMAGEIVTFV